MGSIGRSRKTSGLYLRAYGAWFAAIAAGMLVGASLDGRSADPYGLAAFVLAIAAGLLVLTVLTLALGLGMSVLLLECALAAVVALISGRLPDGGPLVDVTALAIPAMAVFVVARGWRIP